MFGRKSQDISILKDYTKELEKKREDIEAEIAKSQPESKTPTTFKIDDLVLYKPDKISKKSAPRMQGPFIISEILSPYRYRIKPIDGGDPILSSYKTLKKFIRKDQTDEDLKKAKGKDDQTYLIEDIISHRYGKKLPIRFKVRWSGYTSSEDTWPDWPSLKDTEAIDRYLKRHPALAKRIQDKEVNI
ncbi:hypothetical protein ADUPG1_002968, partial [Aduncisulcus paluster]